MSTPTDPATLLRLIGDVYQGIKPEDLQHSDGLEPLAEVVIGRFHRATIVEVLGANHTGLARLLLAEGNREMATIHLTASVIRLAEETLSHVMMGPRVTPEQVNQARFTVSAMQHHGVELARALNPLFHEMGIQPLFPLEVRQVVAAVLLACGGPAPAYQAASTVLMPRYPEPPRHV
jgi:hypothetical protein